MEIPDGLTGENRELVREIMDAHGYDSLTQTQEQAFNEDILTGGNHLLVAKTGNGKTLCAEAITKQTLDAGGRVAYLVPSANLVGDKYDEIQEWAEDYTLSRGGSYEGSYSSGDVIVATFDSFYQAIIRDAGGVTGVDTVVLDDFHEIYGSFRGPEIEKSIAAILDNNIRIFAMSATLGNPDELGRWMNANPIISEEDRRIEIVEEPIEVAENDDKKEVLTGHIRNHRDYAPFLVFNSSRNTAESRAEQTAALGIFDNVSTRDFMRELREETDMADPDITEDIEELVGLMESGVAYHHAGLPAPVKRLIEDGIRNGDIKCTFCTTTIAYGFDAPIQSVIVADLKRWNGITMEYIGVHEYVQWIGRAARPGKGFDPGYAFPLYSDFDGAEQFFGDRELGPVESHVQNDDTFRKFLLEMIEMGWTTPEEIESFFKNTLYWEQLAESGAWDRERGPKIDQLRDALRTHVDWLETHGFVSETPSGGFQTTDFGSAAVDFEFETFASARLPQIKSMHTWLQGGGFTPADLFLKIATEFGISVSGNPTSEFVDTMNELGLPNDEYGHLVALISGYWMKNWGLEKTKEETGMDVSYLSKSADKIAEYMRATEHLIDASPNVREPDWYETIRFRLEAGVRNEEVMIAKNVDQMGRHKIRELSRRLDGVSLIQGSGATTVLERVRELQEQSNKDQTLAVLQDVRGIGDTLSVRVLDSAMSLSDSAVEATLDGVRETSEPDTGRPEDVVVDSGPEQSGLGDWS